MTLNPFTAEIPKPASRGTITLTGEEYDAVRERARVQALEEAAKIVTGMEVDDDGPWDACAKNIARAIRALIERERKP